ncbi:recombinase RecT [Oceanirhabdus sp. W0125-5]|uniref:recombinase RecT n=1 Tax=Oceanirhabdus sp. W0125-5 TaxID=2999116 RepID=UPI0022F2F4E4|nr:recombinase RecT [Oceanirhabdus sp. W0125-5]WBW95277.1 recombinase RecT [Oceanirhabdus sp. W0125-5]
MPVNTSTVKEKLAKKTDNSKGLAQGNGFQNVLVKQLKQQFKAIESLVPKHVTPERLCRVGLNAVSRNPKIMECSPDTVVGAIVNCATLGLEPNLLGHAYIVPFWNGKTSKFEAQFQIGYKGALDLVRRTGAVSTITAHEVYSGDEFEYAYGLDEKLRHIPCGEDDESKITHFYACYKLKDGGTGFVVMSRAQMDKHRDRFTKSKNKQNKVFGPWADHYVSMGLKTVILKLIKYMPISIEQQESQKILEGLQRDNGVSTVKEPEVGFGDAYINTEYSINHEEKGEK